MTDEQDIHKYERFFRDPKVGERLLQPPHSGTACQNIRIGLKLLDYELHVRNDRYDDQLAAIVEQFQSDNNHTSVDGKVGPSTRRLLALVLWQKRGVDAFNHMEDPEEQLKLRAQEPIQKDIKRKQELIETAIPNLRIVLKVNRELMASAHANMSANMSNGCSAYRR